MIIFWLKNLRDASNDLFWALHDNSDTANMISDWTEIRRRSISKNKLRPEYKRITQAAVFGVPFAIRL